MPSFFPCCAHDCRFGTAASTSRHTPEIWCNLHRTTVSGYNGWPGLYIGCFKEPTCGATTSRKMKFLVGFPGSEGNEVKEMTPGFCIGYAKGQGYAYAAVQYGSECYGGNDISAYTSPGQCGIACTGDSRITCGGACESDIFLTAKAVDLQKRSYPVLAAGWAAANTFVAENPAFAISLTVLGVVIYGTTSFASGIINSRTKNDNNYLPIWSVAMPSACLDSDVHNAFGTLDHHVQVISPCQQFAWQRFRWISRQLRGMEKGEEGGTCVAAFWADRDRNRPFYDITQSLNACYGGEQEFVYFTEVKGASKWMGPDVYRLVFTIHFEIKGDEWCMTNEGLKETTKLKPCDNGKNQQWFQDREVKENRPRP
jgi:hypothetical protein